MIKEKKTTEEITTRYRYCDDCGAEIPRGLMCSVARCEICKKDLCNNCIGNEGDSYGDYRTVHCKSCWSIGETYRIKIEELANQIEKLHNEWASKCKT